METACISVLSTLQGTALKCTVWRPVRTPAVLLARCVGWSIPRYRLRCVTPSLLWRSFRQRVASDGNGFWACSPISRLRPACRITVVAEVVVLRHGCARRGLNSVEPEVEPAGARGRSAVVRLDRQVAFADWTQPDSRGIRVVVQVIHDPVSVAVRDGLIRGQRPIEVVRSTTRDVPARVREDRVLDARHRTVSTRPPLNARDSSRRRC
jgi:hypothetical protein